MSKTEFNRLDLFLKEVGDPYAQENWYRLKLFLEENFNTDADITTIVNSVVSASSVWEKVAKTLPASVTTIADSFSLSSFRQADYVINFKDATSAKEKGLKLSVIKDDGSLKDHIYSIQGSAISLEITSQINGSNFELEVVNNEAFDVEMSFTRLKTT